jgi:TolB-like protein/Tfp pilus assembly protein PilF/predicted Ser/Thr protein kinase
MEQPSVQRRTETLRQACADDPGLFREAEALLNQDTTSLEHFAEFAETWLRDDPPSRVGERLGAYAITREIGRGGMGAVYLARRADGQFEKQVAIKILKRGTDTEDVLRRFRDERQILANLEHPNITRLLDAGVTSDNLPYVVMEFVDGKPITDFVREEGCALSERLALFLKVCEPVELAHKQGVIHRDIKPSNVLVKNDGEVKLLDFSIAKLLAGDADDVTVALERRLTPKYAAPEQTTGQVPTIATDIFSLGKVLSELLPNGNESASEQVSCLNKVVRRATEAQPQKRYPSVRALADAVKECVADSPVQTATGLGRQRKVLLPIAAGLILLTILVGTLAWSKRTSWFKNAVNSAPLSSQASDIHSIAILPFDPLTQDKDDLLGLGMADAVISRLSGLKQLMVLPTAAVSRFRGQSEDVIADGKKLNVDAVLNGTVQQAQGRIRVTVQLVNVASRRTIWADTFDQTSTDIFAIQDSISEKVARSLLANLSEADRQQLEKHYTGDTAAYESYLLGVSAYNLRTKEGLEKAIDNFQQAVTTDPHYALAFALMSDCYFLQSYYRFEPSGPALARARSAAEKAIALDSSLPEAHLAMSTIQRFDSMGSPPSEDSPGIQSLLQAINLNPNYALAHQRYAWFLCGIGKLEQGVQEMGKAQSLNPLSPTNDSALGILLLFARRYEEGIDYCERAVKLNQNDPGTQTNLAAAYLVGGRYDRAMATLRKIEELDPTQHGDVTVQTATVLVRAGRREEADKLMSEVRKLAKESKVMPYNLTLLYVARGEFDEAINWLRRAESWVTTQPGTLRYDPQLDPLRSDRRFQVFLAEHDLTCAGKIHRVAILPFRPLGSENNDERLGLGMADAVIGQMSKLKQINVLPTSAVLRYVKGDEEALTAAHALNADAVLTGTVQRSGDRIRVSAQLISASDGEMLWSEKFDQIFTDVFGVQDSISAEIAKTLALDLSPEQRKQMVKRNTNSTEAYDAYVMGLYFYNKRSKEALQKAINYFDDAIAKDPNYALAHALLADCYNLQADSMFAPSAEVLPKCRQEAERALSLDATLPEAHVAMAMAMAKEKNNRAAVQSLHRALELNPNLAIAHQRYAWTLCELGQMAEAVAEMKRAQELDPLSPANNASLGLLLTYARRFPEALPYCRRAVELEPDNPTIQGIMAHAYYLNGMFEAAIGSYRRFMELRPEERATGQAAIAAVLYKANRRSEADAIMPEILPLATEGKIDPYAMTVLYAANGQIDQGLEWFGKALANGQASANAIRYGAELDSLRRDRRFNEYLKRYAPRGLFGALAQR